MTANWVGYTLESAAEDIGPIGISDGRRITYNRYVSHGLGRRRVERAYSYRSSTSRQADSAGCGD